MDTNSLHFHAEPIQNPHTPRIHMLGVLSDENNIIHAHSRFNFSNSIASENTLYINTIATFKSYIQGHVLDILGENECKPFENQSPKLAIFSHCAEKMIEEIIHTSPEYIRYIVIPCAHSRLHELQSHYLKIGENLQKKGIIKQKGYHLSDCIYFELQKS